jgi:hypothetical protein
VNNGMERYWANFKDSDILSCAFVFTIIDSLILQTKQPARSFHQSVPTRQELSLQQRQCQTEPHVAVIQVLPGGPQRTQGEPCPTGIRTRERPNTNHGAHNSTVKFVATQCYSIDRCQYNGAITPILKSSYLRLPAGRSGGIPVTVRFPTPVLTGHGARPEFCKMGTGIHLWGKATGACSDLPPSSAPRLKED